MLPTIAVVVSLLGLLEHRQVKAQFNNYGVDQDTYYGQCSWELPPMRVDGFGYLPANDTFYVNVANSQNYGTVMRARGHRGQPLGIGGLKTGWTAFQTGNSLQQQRVFEVSTAFFFLKNGVYGGDNKQLIGCPTSLCLASGIDFLNYRASHREVFLQMGFHEWPFTPRSRPYLSETRPINNGMSATTALNFPELRYTIFLEDNNYTLTFENATNRLDGTISVTYNTLSAGDIKAEGGGALFFRQNFPTQVDGATVQRIGGTFNIHTVAGDLYCRHVLQLRNTTSTARGSEIAIVRPNRPVALNNFNRQLARIDEMFLDPLTNDLYLFRTWMFFRTKVVGDLEDTLRSLNIIWRPIHTDLFGCSDPFYRRYGLNSYTEFQRRFVPLDGTASDQLMGGFFSAFNIYLFMAILCLIVAAAIGGTFAARRWKQRSWDIPPPDQTAKRSQVTLTKFEENREQ